MSSLFSRRALRPLAVGVLAGLALPALATAASAHAGFASSAAFGFAPNTRGGTGADNVAPPYVAGSTNQVLLRVPYEQTEPFNGAPDTTVDVRAIVPAGFTAPACGPAKLQVRSADTNDTNQPGADATGWTCEVLTENGHQVLHWSGSQVSAAQTSADSAQFFVFTVTAPAPDVQTTYNGTNGTEGFIVDQRYASGETEHWIPNDAYPGTAPAGAITTVAGGLARTVAAVGAPQLAGVSPRVVTVGQRLKVTVTGTPGNVVDLLAKVAPATTYAVVRSVTMPASGTFTWDDVTPRHNTALAAKIRDTELLSTSVPVQVRSAVGVVTKRTAERSYAFSGFVSPFRAGQLVTLYQFKADGTRSALVSSRVEANGRWSLSYAFAIAKQRSLVVQAAATPVNVTGLSLTISLLTR